METEKGFSMDREVLRGRQIKTMGFCYGYNERTGTSGYRHTGQIVLWLFLYRWVGEVLKDSQQKVVMELASKVEDKLLSGIVLCSFSCKKLFIYLGEAGTSVATEEGSEV